MDRDAIIRGFIGEVKGEIDPQRIRNFDIIPGNSQNEWFLHAIPAQEWFAEVNYQAGIWWVVLHDYLA